MNALEQATEITRKERETFYQYPTKERMQDRTPQYEKSGGVYEIEEKMFFSGTSIKYWM